MILARASSGSRRGGTVGRRSASMVLPIPELKADNEVPGLVCQHRTGLGQRFWGGTVH